MDKPTRPAGCFLQLIGAAILIYATYNVAFEDWEKVIIFAPVGAAIMYFGRRSPE